MLPRIIILGDSVLKGVVFDNIKQRYRLLKESVVSLFVKETKLDVTNCAIYGATIQKGGQQFLRRKDSLGAYTHALLEFGGNDCDFNWSEISSNPDGLHLPNTPMAEFITRYEQLIDDLRENNVTPILMSLPPLDPDRFFKTISTGLNADNILKWLGGYKDTTYRWHESYNLAVLELARKKSVPVIEVRSAFLIRNDYRELICEDGIHPNEKGHKVILDKVLDFIKPLNLVPVG